ncbi:MAG: hypothetical protein LIO77_04220 [Rikenellaceae bacterium]|nr:hypothetical protein [Rikenellaceae bacterium]
MIELQARKHDSYSIEFKAGYIATDRDDKDQLSLNMWIFVPNSLDINSETYSKKQFYRDTKSKVRLITPVFELGQIARGRQVPLRNLENSFRILALYPSRTNIADYEYEIKMFMAIFQSSIRDATEVVIAARGYENVSLKVGEYLQNVKEIVSSYRSLQRLISVPSVPPERFNYFLFGDEFMSNVAEAHLFRLIKNLRKRGEKYHPLTEEIISFITAEREYSREMGYPVAEAHSPDRNRSLIFRQGVLEKYIQSDLALHVQKKRDGVAIEQMYFSLAAGISMVFATAIAFSFQQRYGNFTMPLFVALVVSYMLKDRIKDLMRYWFAYRLKGKYFDNKTKLSIKEDEPFAMIREGVDFITEDKVPAEVMELRNRSALLQAENRLNNEKIILYRKMIKIDSEKLHEENRYKIDGINDIITFYLASFINKSHTAEVPLYTVDQSGIKTILGEKIYYLNIILQLKHATQEDYKRYRVVFTRNGIKELEHLR